MMPAGNGSAKGGRSRLSERTRVHGTAYYSTEGIPRRLVKPVPELVEALIDKYACCAIVEPDIALAVTD